MPRSRSFVALALLALLAGDALADRTSARARRPARRDAPLLRLSSDNKLIPPASRAALLEPGALSSAAPHSYPAEVVEAYAARLDGGLSPTDLQRVAGAARPNVLRPRPFNRVLGAYQARMYALGRLPVEEQQVVSYLRRTGEPHATPDVSVIAGGVLVQVAAHNESHRHDAGAQLHTFEGVRVEPPVRVGDDHLVSFSHGGRSSGAFRGTARFRQVEVDGEYAWRVVEFSTRRSER